MAATLLGGCALAEGDPAHRTGQIEWNGRGALFGGLSGVLITDNGRGLLAVGDQGLLVTADLIRNPDGTLVSVREHSRYRLRDPQGVEQFNKGADAESLAVLGDKLLIALEGRNTIWSHDTIGAIPVAIAVPEGIANLQYNSGIEALASTDDGALLAIPERSGGLDRPFPVYRLRGDVWDSDLQIPRHPPFLPTGADVGPDGRLYVLERAFTGLSFRVQVRSFAIGEQLHDMRVVLAPRRDLDNAEGIDIWRDDRANLRMTIISDDNFVFLQRTLLSEYVLDAAD